jgi:hypothetical protein
MTEAHVDEFEASGNSPTLACRECGATRAERRDSVSGRPAAYTCSGCLMGVKRANGAMRTGLEAPRKDRSSSLCLLGGKHPSGSPWAAECPLDPARVERRSERARRANKVRWARRGSR